MDIFLRVALGTVLSHLNYSRGKKKLDELPAYSTWFSYPMSKNKISNFRHTNSLHFFGVQIRLRNPFVTESKAGIYARAWKKS
jgi:hypothetical protein